MAIGTTNKPVGQDERDIDLVCEMALPAHINQSQVKKMLGDRLRENETYAAILKEKNRCWRLSYSGQFHMDILPAKPDPRTPSESALVIPDKELRCWKETDPKSYTNWFKVQAARSLRRNETGIQAGIEPPPAYTSVWDKTPLQVAVQLLKRHRDVTLNGQEHSPISIIITTLAGRAYQGQASIYATTMNLLQRMPKFIEYDADGLPYVRNPTNELENFADKWHQKPIKKLVFDRWIISAQNDLISLGSTTLSESDVPLGKFLGVRHASHALKAYGEHMHRQRRTGLRIATGTGLLGVSGAQTSAIPKNTFYGDDTTL